MADEKSWKPKDDEALKELIRETIKAAGPLGPDAIPHKVRERLRGRATGDLDIDSYIKEVIAESKKNA